MTEQALDLDTEPVREWSEGPFRVLLWHAGTQQGHRDILAYRFFHDDALIFEGADFSPSPMFDAASDDSVYSLLGFLCLQPGDTDPEFFESYTPQQLAWAQTWGEELSYLVSEHEEHEEREEREA